METNDFRIVAARAFLATRPGLTAQELAAENAQLRELLTRTVDLADDCADAEPPGDVTTATFDGGVHMCAGDVLRLCDECRGKLLADVH
jgi:hypothetical protein